MPGLVIIALAAVVAAALANLIPGHQDLQAHIASLYSVTAASTVCIGCWFTNWRFVAVLPVVLLIIWVWLSNSLQVPLADSIVGQGLSITGRIVSFPVKRDGLQRFEFVPLSDDSLEKLPQKLSLSWYDSDYDLGFGEVWRLQVRLKEPRGLLNPGSSEFSRMLYIRGIAAYGYVQDSSNNQRLLQSDLDVCRMRVDCLWFILRGQLVRFISSHIDKASPALPILVALSSGSRHLLSDHHWEVFRRTGTSHLMAISGLHISLLAGLGFVIGCCLLVFGLPAATPWVSASLFGFFYAGLSGFGLPAVRALLMLLVLLQLVIARRDYNGFDLLSVATIVTLFIHPWAVFTAAFWLSFTAVAVLIHCARLIPPEIKTFALTNKPIWKFYLFRLRELLVLQFLLVTVLALPGIGFFGELSLVAPLVNLVAIPIFSFVIVPFLLLAILLAPVSIGLSSILLRILAAIVETGFEQLALLASLPFALLSVPAVSLVAIGLAAIGLVLLMLPSISIGRRLFVILLLPVAAGEIPTAVKHLEIDVFDVGHGLAVLLRFQNKALIYDTGPAWRSSDAGSSIVVPALRSMGLEQLDTIIVSHSDADHSGGLSSILHAYPMAEQYTCSAGDRWQWINTGLDADTEDIVKFEVLHPEIASEWSDNNGSCVLLIYYRGQRILLPGDVETPAEISMLAAGVLSKVDLVIIPHHGSNTSSTAGFVKALQPRFAIASAGWRNRWKFPREQVVQRWRAQGACVLSTANTGAMRFVIDDHGLSLQSMLRDNWWQRIWPWSSAVGLKGCPTLN